MTYRYGRRAMMLLVVLLAGGAVWMAACNGTSGDAGSMTSDSGGTFRRMGPHGGPFPQWVRLLPGEREALIVYAGVSHGAITACGCANNPTGGFSKELTMIEQVRRGGLPMLYLHPGDVFPFEAKPEKAPFVAEAASKMGYDALCVGEQELIGGLDRFRELMAKHRLPYLSANLRDGAGKEIAPPYFIKDLAGIKVGIIGITGSERYLYLDEKFLEEAIPQPVALALEAALGELDGKVDFLILLSHQDKYLDRELAYRFPQINLIVGGHDEELIAPPIRVGRTLLVNAGILGERLGVLHLAVDPAKHVRVLGNEFLPTPAPVPLNSGIEAVYKRFVEATGAVPEENQAPLPQAFQPASSCEPCHKGIYDVYLKSPHARAWQALVDAGREGDRQCWFCHTMGYDRQGGFRGIRETPDLAGVSCQACHLQTSDHAARSIIGGTDYARDDRVCRQCHTRTTSPDFSVWQAAEKIDHHAVEHKTNSPPADYRPPHVKADRPLPEALKEKPKE